MVDIAEVIRPWAWRRPRWSRDSRDVGKIIVNSDRADHGTDTSLRTKLCSSAALENDLVGRPGHGADIGVLKGCYPGVDRKGIQKNYLKKHLDVGKEALNVVQQLRRKLVAQGASVAKFTGELTWRTAKMAKENFAGLRIG